jgi:alanine racemase
MNDPVYHDRWDDEAKEHRPSFVQVDLGAIRRNVQRLKELPTGEALSRLMAVVKADAYGHGVLPVAKRALASGADWLGVALPQEALVLREAGIAAPVLILGYSEPGSYRRLVEAGVRLTVFSLSQGEALAKASREAGKKPSFI